MNERNSLYALLLEGKDCLTNLRFLSAWHPAGVHSILALDRGTDKAGVGRQGHAARKGVKGQGDGEFGQCDQGPRDDGRPLWEGPRAGVLGC